MSSVPSELKYTESHEWIGVEADGSVRIGITDHAQEQLGDLVFVELPEQGERLDQGESCAVVESVKAASDIYAPITGQVVAVNESLDDDPGLINSDPYGDGWLFSVSLDDVSELEGLMDAEAYEGTLDD
ncbi:MAG: glycine cleavage system protein GcvH [Xanthomonadales bacterium]|nr:glycine cleavage system protein GcvH [Gammaproteobacteria bacterium]NNL94781.1 glycine cleavage system protein GcvH [Xanthomonadales bacterium]